MLASKAEHGVKASAPIAGPVSGRLFRRLIQHSRIHDLSMPEPASTPGRRVLVMNSLGRSAIRSTVVILALFALVVAGVVTGIAKGARAAGTGVEDNGAGCQVSLPGSLTANSMLPDPFTRLNGTRISSVSDWTCRREEILQLQEKYIYGAKPPKPASVSGTVTRTGITVNVTDQGKSSSFSATVTLPSGNGPFPAVILYGGIGADTNTILGSGVAVINYNQYAVGM